MASQQGNVAAKLAADYSVIKNKNKKNYLHRLRPVILGSLLPIILIVVWEIFSKSGFVPAHQLPAPSTILGTIKEMFVDGTLWQHVGITTYRVFIGFVLGSVIAIILGSFVGLNTFAEHMFDPLIQAFRSIPSLAWVPLFILWMGIGEPSKVTMIAVGVFFPVYLNIVSG